MTIQQLHNLIHQFNTHEQSLIRYAIKGSKELDENKSLQLFEFVIGQEKCPSRAVVSKAVYNAAPDTRVNKLISRLWEKALDIITSENFLGKNERLVERSLLRIGVRKKMTQYTTLGLLNDDSDAYHLLLENSIRDAIRSEYHITLIELYGVKKQWAIFNSNIKEYNFCSRQIIYYKRCYNVQEKVTDYYTELQKASGYGGYESPKKIIKYLEGILAELKKEKKYIASVYSRYMFSLIQLDYLFYKENFSSAKRLLKQVLKKIGSSPLARGNTHITSRIESELCICEMFLGNYDQAIKHIENSFLLQPKSNNLNYYIALQRLFQVVFYKGDLFRAEEILTKLLSEYNSSINEFRNATGYYLQACLYFKKREYKQGLDIVNKPMPLNKDKTGYDISVRVLRIQCLLALERFDEASVQIENLRKHISRNDKKTYTSERNKVITRVLTLMQKRGFSWKQNKTESELFKTLSASTGKYKWTPNNFELIKFHEWYGNFNGKKSGD